jgi:transcriptional regulator with XRE-family HTH domain
MSLKGPFGAHLRDLRKGAELTQAQLAELTGYSHDQISMIELGNRAPSFELLEALAVALHCHPQELFNFPWPESTSDVADL